MTTLSFIDDELARNAAYETLVHNMNAQPTLAEAATRAARWTRSVMVTAQYEYQARHRILRWDGERPYVLIGRRIRHREYLTGFRHYEETDLFVFTSEPVTICVRQPV